MVAARKEGPLRADRLPPSRGKGELSALRALSPHRTDPCSSEAETLREMVSDTAKSELC